MLGVLLNIFGVGLGLVGLITLFGSLMPRWGGSSSDSATTRLVAVQAVLVGIGLYIASFFVG